MRRILAVIGIVAQLVVASSGVHDVRISSFDGVQLAATYYAPSTSGPAVVLFRNCDQGRASMNGFAGKLAARGAHVIVYDYRVAEAAGRSWRETRSGDADRVYDWLASQPGVDRTRLGVVGGSCGVALALDFAAHHAEQVRGIVILSGPSDAAQRAFIARTPSIGVLGAASVEEGAAVGYVQPVVAASTNRASRMVVLRGAGHGTEIFKGSTSFEATTLDWLDERLAAARREWQLTPHSPPSSAPEAGTPAAPL
ncbi:MAG: alpha/beta hydrolase fold domain-containing protein [Gemmatimonadetes bacterium]|jgi:dienelactone hydrolase|nr:alpha/beta hydrolase fold domain-containing protein [Gemmatimonadota bacterium]